MLTLSSSKSYEIPLGCVSFIAMVKDSRFATDDAFLGARESVRMWCAQRERSTAQCRRKLQKYGLSQEQTDAIITGLQEDNFLSDERFAEAFVTGHIRIKRWGRHKIRQHLSAEGLPDYLIREAVDRYVDPDVYEENLKMLLSRKLQSLGDSSTHPAVRQKAIRYMQQKGYETEKVISAIEALTGG